MTTMPIGFKRSDAFEFPANQPVSPVGALAGIVGYSGRCSGRRDHGQATGYSRRVCPRVVPDVLDQGGKTVAEAAVLRLGRYVGLRGPGIFHVIPVIETLSKFVDQRIRVTDVTAESALTRDTVPVNVDAIVFWVVWNAEKAILEVEDFTTPSR